MNKRDAYHGSPGELFSPPPPKKSKFDLANEDAERQERLNAGGTRNDEAAAMSFATCRRMLGRRPKTSQQVTVRPKSK